MNSGKRGKMLVHVAVLLNVAIFCYGKSLDFRGRQSYDYNQGPEPQYQAYYDQQNNHNQPPNGYYYPQMDGQPIYMPSVAQSASDLKDYLDDYYYRDIAYTTAWQHATPGPLDYNVNNYYENPATANSIVKNFLGKTDDEGHRGDYHILPEGQLEYNLDSTDKTKKKTVETKEIIPKPSKKGAAAVPQLKVKPDKEAKDPEYVLDEYKQPVVLDENKEEKLENLEASKAEPTIQYLDEEYELPMVHKTKKVDKKPVKTIIKSELDVVDDYEEPGHDKMKKVDKKPIIKPASTIVDDYDEAIVGDKIKADETSIIEPELANIGDYDELVVKDRINKGNKKQIKPEDEDYEEPIVIERINIKDKKPSSDSVLEISEYTDDEPAVVHKVSNPVKMEVKVNKNERIPHPGYEVTIKTNQIKKSKGKRKKSPPIKKYKSGNLPVVKVSEDRDIAKKEHKKSLDYEYELEKKEEVIKQNTPVKIKEKVVVKENNEKPVKIKEKVVVKENNEKPVKIKEKVVVKENNEKPVKIKEKVVVKPKHPVKVKEKVVVKPKHPVKVKEKVIKTELDEYEPEKLDHAIMGKNGIESDMETPLVEKVDDLESSDLDARNMEDLTEENVLGDEFGDLDGTSGVSKLNIEEGEESDLEEDEESDLNHDNITPMTSEIVVNNPKLLSNIDSLSSLNSNIWSLLFNPNAERNKRKQCVTRNNETGYCLYVQHCEVPDIVTSFEQLLNNACVMDDVFIGVCCPEFPVQTVKVQWEHDASASNKEMEEEFGHNNDDDCGIRSNEASEMQSWPWMAPLVSMSTGKIFCGGVLISEDYVLTAAHCTTKIPRNQILVRLGQRNDVTGEDFAVVEIKRHAQYNPRTMHNDIALLKLGRRIVHDKFTGIICLPDDDDDDDEHDGEKAVLLGWKGMFGTSKKTEVLKVMDNKECGNKLRMNVPKTVLCTEARNEDERTCNADSGAPLVIEDDDKYEVIGILGWNRNDCDQRFPSTFSKVSRYVGWIRKHAV